MDFQLSELKFIKNKNFITMTNNNDAITFKIMNALFPFGIEEYKGKRILNCEISIDKNSTYNILADLNSIELMVKKHEFNNAPINVIQSVREKGFMPAIKKSLNGTIIRTHISSPDIYILKKNGDKMFIDEINLKGATGIITLTLNGIWLTEDNFGLLFMIKDIQITKLS